MKPTNKEKLELYKFAVMLEEISEKENIKIKEITVSDYTGEINVTFTLNKEEDRIIEVN